MNLTLGGIRACFDGRIPSIIATCAADGTPNVSWLSEVQYIDEGHVALSFQFFNKTHANVVANPQATLLMLCPVTAAHYRLRVEYVRTETAGPIFESMKARLAGIAALSGMAAVFRLLGADIYRVCAIERVPGRLREAQPPSRNYVMALREVAARIAGAGDLASLGDVTLEAMSELLGYEHAIILTADNKYGRLYTLASRGYDRAGIGSDVPYGAGVIGLAARERTPIRIAYATADYLYGRAVYEQTTGDKRTVPEAGIPLPQIAEMRSQLAVPVVHGDQLLGVIAAQSDEDGRFTGVDEDALAAVASQFGLALRALDTVASEAGIEAAPSVDGRQPVSGRPIQVRHYAENDSVFLDDDYLIKGVAGAIFWKLARDYQSGGRTEFTNRELRLSSEIRLPELSENLEARLVLLARRLSERGGAIRIERTGRGRFRLCVNRPLCLVSG